MITLSDNVRAGDRKIAQQNEDSRRGDFLRAIDGDEANLSDFEVKFVGDFIKARGKSNADLDFQWFTAGRRQVVDNMIHRYGLRTLKQSAAPVVPQAEPGHCGYLKRDEETRKQTPCGAKAVIKLRNGLELCADCNRVREQGLAMLRAAKERRLRS